MTGRGHCSAVEDGVLLGKREAGERSVTGRGPRIRLLSFATTKSQKKKKKGGFITAGSSLSLLFEGPSHGLGHTAPTLDASARDTPPCCILNFPFHRILAISHYRAAEQSNRDILGLNLCA